MNNFFESMKGYRFVEVEWPRMICAIEAMTEQLCINNQLLRENNALLKEATERVGKGNSELPKIHEGS